MEIERYEKIIILSILLVLLLLKTYKMTVAPGLEVPQSLDENFIGMYVTKIMSGETVIALFHYVGPHGIYLATVSSYLFDINLFSMRFLTLMIFISAFLLLYYLVRNKYGVRTALIFSLIFNLLPSYLILTRPFYTHLLNYLLFILIFYMLFKFEATKNKNIIYLIAFLIGSSIAIHIHTIYFVIALVFALIFLKINIPKNILLLSLLFFMIGVFPLIYYNFIPCDTGETFCTARYIQSSIFLTGRGTYNIETIQNFVVLSEAFLFDSLFGASINPLLIRFYLFTFSILLLVSVVYAVMKKNRFDLFLISFIGIFFLENIFTTGGIGPMPLIILLPLLFIFISNFITRFKLHVIGLIIIFILALNSLSYISYFDNFRDMDKGSIESVAKYVIDDSRKNIVVDDWMVYYALVFHVGKEKDIYRCYDYNEIENSIFVFYTAPASTERWSAVKGTYIVCSDEFYSRVNQNLKPLVINEYKIFS